MPPNRKRSKRAIAVEAAKKIRMELNDAYDVAEQDEEQTHDEVQFVHAPYKSDAELLSLDDDCFFSIFNHLPLIDVRLTSFPSSSSNLD